VVVNPATPAAVLEEILPEVDQVVGHDGQSRFRAQHFSIARCQRSNAFAGWSSAFNARCEVEVDGALIRKLRRWLVQRVLMCSLLDRQFFGDSVGVVTAMSRLRASIAHNKSTLLA